MSTHRRGARRAPLRLLALALAAFAVASLAPAVSAASPDSTTVTPTSLSPEAYYMRLLNCSRTGGYVNSDGSCTGYGSGRYSAYVTPITYNWGLMLKSYRGDHSRGPLVLWRNVHRHAQDLIHRYGVATPGPHLRARDLSGGNLQKLVLGREFAGSPKVLIAASPTRGLDVGAIETVHAYLRKRRATASQCC